MPVGTLGTQDFESQSELTEELVRDRVMGFLDAISLLELVTQIRPDEPTNIPSLFAVEVSHAPQRVCAKDEAPENISSMLVTLDTSHLERSALKDDAW